MSMRVELAVVAIYFHRHQVNDRVCRKLFEVTVWFSSLHHLFAISIERIVDDPLGCIYLVIVFVAEMPEAFGNGLKSRAFRLTIQRIVGVCGVDNFPEKDKRGLSVSLYFLR